MTRVAVLLLLAGCSAGPGLDIPPSNPLDRACAGEWVDADPTADVPTSFTFALTPEPDFAPALVDVSVDLDLDAADAEWKQWRPSSAPCAQANTTWASWDDVDLELAADLTSRGTLDVFVDTIAPDEASMVAFDGKTDRSTTSAAVEQRAADEGVDPGWFELDVGLQVMALPGVPCELLTCFYGVAASEDNAVTSIDYGTAGRVD